MKTFKIMMLMITISLLSITCSHDDSRNLNHENVENSSMNSLHNRISASENINILFEGKRFEQQEDNSVAYYDEENNFVGDILLESYEMDIEDNTSTSGEIIVTNPSTNESLTIRNIVNEGGRTIFDVITSEGIEFPNIVGYQGTAEVQGFPIVPIVRAVVTIVTVIAVASTSGGTQAECTASMPKSCPQGSVPYAEYTSGWFSSSCNVGCRK